MLRLPGQICVSLQDVSGRPLAAADVLVAINILLDGRYYYGNIIGLTNSNGKAKIDRDELYLRFAADRVSFPMDYKVDLDDADPFIEVVLMSTEEVNEGKAAIEANQSVSGDIKACFFNASNSKYRPSMTRFWGDLPNERKAVIALTTSIC